jgi:hypothetical protein
MQQEVNGEPGAVGLLAGGQLHDIRQVMSLPGGDIARWRSVTRYSAGDVPPRRRHCSLAVHVGFVVDKVALEQVFPTSVFPCQFHSTGAPLLVKLCKKLLIFIFITGLHKKP